MKAIPFPQIVGPSYTLNSVNAECQRCVNMFVERIESNEGKNVYWLRPTPGLELFLTLPDSPIMRMIYTSVGRAFAITKNTLYEIYTDGTYTSRYSFSYSNDKVKVSDNGLGLLIAKQTTSYFFKFSDNTMITSSSFVGSYLGGTFVDFLDQYLLVNRPSTNQFQISPLAYNGSQTWDAADVFSAESNADYITGAIVNGREYWLFGPNSYEVWFSTTDANRPFQRISDAAFNIGCVAPYTIEAISGNVFWLGGSKEGYGIVWMSQGYQPKRISTFAIEQELRAYNMLDDAEAYSYQLEGHFVYVLRFPSAGKTFNYDITTGLWFETEYRVPVYNTRLAHRATGHIFAFSKNLVSDYSTGAIYTLSPSVYTDNTDPIVRYRRAPTINKLGKRIFYEELMLEVESGVGLASGQGSNPLISVRWSNDSGHTWSNYHNKSIGAIGEYKKQVRFNRLGSAKDRTFEIYLSDPVPFKLITANLTVVEGAY